MTAEVMLIGLLVLLVMNLPIAVAIGMAAVTAFLVQGDLPLVMVIQRMFAGIDSFHLMAVPLFMAAGVIMEAGGISRHIVALAQALVGWLPGGLAAVTILSAMFFAGISGSAAADAVAVGGILIPAMKTSGYRSDFSAAVLASGGSIGVVIPPSIPMIIFGFLTGASIGQLFAAGVLPGVLIAFSLAAVAVFLAGRKGYGARQPFQWAELKTTLRQGLWAMGAPLIILGGIFMGIFTASESAAVAVVYAILVGRFVYRSLSLKDLGPLFVRAGITAGVVLFIISTASVFSWMAAIEEMPARMAGALLNLTHDPVVLLLIVNLFLLVAGTFVETTAALILLVPMIAAMLPALKIDMVQLGVIVVTNLAIGMLTPPMGICLIVSGAISGDPITAVSRRVLPFLAVLLVDLLLISFYSPLTMVLARWAAG
ncbi:MAG: TRAP transporter large permease [Desulfosarcinaceae bacterium]